jgi:hypothetical protein
MKRNHLSLLVALVASGAVAAACSNDNAEPTRPPPIGGDDASTGTGGKGSGGKGATPGTDSGTGGDEASGGNGGGGAVTDGGGATSGDASPSAGGNPATGGAGGSDAGPECDPTETGDHPTACFPCKPSKTVEFLNHCTTSDCQPFDNPGRLGAANWNDGKLIPLP